MSNRIYIVAGNYDQFKAYRNKKFKEWSDYWAKTLPDMTPAVKFPDYVYVQHIDQLIGLSDIDGFFIGTYKDREDYEAIKQQIEIIKSKKVNSYQVYINGVIQYNNYTIKESKHPPDDITNVLLSFTQALPAGSELELVNPDGIVQSRRTFDQFKNYTFQFSPAKHP